MSVNEIADLLRLSCTQEIKIDTNATPHAIVVHESDWISVARILYENPNCYFDLLSCVTGIDNGLEAATMEVVYQLYSIPFDRSLMIKVILPRDNPRIESVVEIWKSANWLERETYDMFGIRFSNHPDLRRILMPSDWEGYPLRKDYQHQEKYRSIQVKY